MSLDLSSRLALAAKHTMGPIGKNRPRGHYSCAISSCRFYSVAATRQRPKRPAPPRRNPQEMSSGQNDRFPFRVCFLPIISAHIVSLVPQFRRPRIFLEARPVAAPSAGEISVHSSGQAFSRSPHGMRVSATTGTGFLASLPFSNPACFESIIRHLHPSRPIKSPFPRHSASAIPANPRWLSFQRRSQRCYQIVFGASTRGTGRLTRIGEYL